MSDEFERLTTPFQHELLVHCYRMLGSLLDAEDALQETLINAWRRRDTLRDPSALRAWLYRIATNVSMDMLDQRKRRGLVQRALVLSANNPADASSPLPPPASEEVWLEPLPEEFLQTQAPGPEARYDLRESVSLAFLALLQTLPGRQRAVLILRDVLGWKSEEVARLLETSATAVNSALQRARATISQGHAVRIESRSLSHTDDRIGALLSLYQQAWESADAASLVSLLCEEAVLTMPPLPAWFSGRDAVIRFYQTHLFANKAAGRFRLVPTRANASPAFAIYERGARNIYYPSTLQVLTVSQDGILRIDSFISDQPGFYVKFGLLSSL